MAEGSPPDNLMRWLVGGLVAGALLLAIILGTYALGGRNGGDSGVAAQTTSTATAPTTTTPPAAVDAAAGKVVFSQSCSGCHAGDGTAAGGVGPKLQGLGLTEAAITAQIRDGGGAMPGGLVEGDDLAAVAAYVVSIQR